jgi:hypothetical protein
MRTQTKCTLTLCGMLIVEILPIPFTALYGIYAIRKRPAWIPEVVERLYADKPAEMAGPVMDVPSDHDHMETRKKCTITMCTMFLVDVVVPFTVPFGIYVVRRRPNWFKDVVSRLYADQLGYAYGEGGAAEQLAESLEQRHRALERANLRFARTLRKKLGRRHRELEIAHVHYARTLRKREE